MFGIVEDASSACFQVRDGIGNHSQVLFDAGLKNYAYLVLGCFADDGRDGGAGIDQCLHRYVIIAICVRSPRIAESGYLCVLEIKFINPLEKFVVLGCRAGVTAFDNVHSKVVQEFRNH